MKVMDGRLVDLSRDKNVERNSRQKSEEKRIKENKRDVQKKNKKKRQKLLSGKQTLVFEIDTLLKKSFRTGEILQLLYNKTINI